MTQFNHGAFVNELRRRREKIPQDLYDDLMAALDAGLAERPDPVSETADPAWLKIARGYMGLKEVPGRQHNATILGWIRELGGWFTDDETPWCGTFVAMCMLRAGYTPPKHWYRAKDWLGFGKETPPRVGAIAVFGRTGGGHVGFVVGVSTENYYILGGNQSNAVNIMPIARDRCLGFRWPASLSLAGAAALPAMSGGTVSRNEA